MSKNLTKKSEQHHVDALVINPTTMTLDEKAEKYADETALSPETYRGDVVTAYICGATDNKLKPELNLGLIGGNWCVTFKIDNHIFRLAPCENKESAEWMKTMLEKALKGL